MKRVLTCQLSIMLENCLPGSIDYEEYSRSFFNQLNAESISLNLPIPDKNAWNQIPPEIPRVIGNSTDVDFNFSANNPSFVIKRVNENWETQLENVISAASRIFEDIGKSYKLKYRFGIILNIQTDCNSMCQNVAQWVEREIIDKTEWQLAFLDQQRLNSISINRWKRFNCNRNEDINNYIIDVNTGPDSNINLRDDHISCVFNTLNSILHEAYDEFTEQDADAIDDAIERQLDL